MVMTRFNAFLSRFSLTNAINILYNFCHRVKDGLWPSKRDNEMKNCSKKSARECKVCKDPIEVKVMELRAFGASIRKIARAVHKDDKRVSAIIKENEKRNANTFSNKTVTATKAVCKIMAERHGLNLRGANKLADVDGTTAKKIYELRRRCLSIKEIAKRIRKSDRYVAAIVDYNKWRCIGADQVKRLHADGLGIKAIARKLHISDDAVRKVVKACGK